MIFQNWLNKPYPLIERPINKILLVLGFGLFTYVFLLIYKPFGAPALGENQVWVLLGFGVMVTIGLSISYFLLPVVFKALFDQKNWQIKKEILFICFSFFIISLLNYFYNNAMSWANTMPHSFFDFLGITFAIGIFPLIILVFLTEIYLNRKNTQQAANLNQQHNPKPITTAKSFTIIADTLKSEPLQLDLERFLFAVSDNNYTTFFYQNEGKTQRQLLRISLKKVVDQLAEFEEIIRCHRSYVVNKQKIQKISGNARSLTLELEGTDETIPVSRSFPRTALL